MSVVPLPRAWLDQVTGGSWLPRTGSFAYPVAFVAAATGGKLASDWLVDHDIGMLHAPAPQTK
jgi:hypothetical protein